MRLTTCNKGALTSKPYSFTSRSWEARREVGIDWFDPCGSNIVLELRGVEIQRVLPSIREEINGEWISDQIRFSYDAIKRQRIDQPFFLGHPRKWIEVFRLFELWFQKNSFFSGFSGKFLTLTTGFFWKWWNSFFFKRSFVQGVDFRGQFLLDASFFSEKGSVLFLGVNPRFDSPIFFLKLRTTGKKDLFQWGFHSVWNFFYRHIGNTLISLVSFLEGTHKLCKKKTFVISSRKFNFSCTGFRSVLWSPDVGSLTKKEWGLAEAADRGYLTSLRRREIVFWLDEDECETSSFSVYFGHHGDKNASDSNLVLPIESPTEKAESFLSFLTYFQKMEKVFDLRGFAKEGQLILTFLIDLLELDVRNKLYKFMVVQSMRKNSLPSFLFFRAVSFFRKEQVKFDNLLFTLPGFQEFERENMVRLNKSISQRNSFFPFLGDSISRSSMYLSLSTVVLKKENYKSEVKW